VIANSLGARDLAWYENPTWERHVIVSDTMQIVNQAPADINGDGIPELAFQSSFAMQAAKSEGLNWLARSQGPGQPWKTEKFDAFPTSHHVVVGGSRRRRQEGIDQRAADRRQRASRPPTIRTRRRCSGTTRAAGSATSSPKRSRHHSSRASVKWDSGNREQLLSPASKASSCIAPPAAAKR
jgi:hypothetical protein